MDWERSLTVFARVAELSSFTKAAAALSLPKSRVSTVVRDLEDELGARLFHRTTRQVHLTRAGHALQLRARDLLADLDELRAMFEERSSLRGRVRVDMPSRLAHELVIPELPSFLDAHPNLEVELGCTDRFVDLVREGFDCILRVGELRESSLIARRIGAFRMANFASPTYLARFGTPQTLDDLAAHRLIRYAGNFDGPVYGFEAMVDGVEELVAMPISVTVNNAGSYTATCLAGLGLIQVPDLAPIRALVDAGRLVEVLPAYRAESMPVSLLYAERRSLAKRVRVFMDWMAETLAPHLE
ncbi:MAG: LysR family transcriptional regulator [Myxococcota bacterium]